MYAVFIYALKEPNTDEIRYIGKTKNINQRLNEQLSEARRSPKHTHRNIWLRSLLRQNLKPSVEIVDEVPEAEWQAWEAAYIQFYLEQGCRLVNSTPGGEGTSLLGNKNPFFGKTHTAEARNKIAIASRNRAVSDQTRAKMSMATLGKKRSLETRKKLSESKRGTKNFWFGRMQSTEMRKKNSDAHIGSKNNFFGKKHSMESRLKMSLAKQQRPGTKHTEATKERLRQFRTGKRHSPAAIAKIKIKRASQVMTVESNQKRSQTLLAFWRRKRDLTISSANSPYAHLDCAVGPAAAF